MFNKIGDFAKRQVSLVLVGFTVFGGAAMAQSTGTTIDVSAPLAMIAAAVVAYNLIGPAWTGFKYLKKVWKGM